MRGGFATLINPPSKFKSIDVDGTKAERDRIHRLMREQGEPDTETILRQRNYWFRPGLV